jgi:hypothetical protein
MITRKVAIQVWTAAGGTCCFPDCSNELMPGAQHLLGEIAHIVARKHQGPRGDPTFPEMKLNLPENLLLLCPYHHAQVDTDVPSFQPEVLRKMKFEHESRIAWAQKNAKPWKQPWHLIHYLNVPRLAMLAVGQGKALNISFSRPIGNLHDLGWELAPLLDSFKATLQELNLSGIALADAEASVLVPGATYSFDTRMWGKNIPGPDALKHGWELKGDLRKDPHIHFKWSGLKMIFAVNPRWLTTSTAFTDLRTRGQTDRISGLAQLKSLSSELAVFTPLIFGIRMTRIIAAVNGDENYQNYPLE